mmetsp:Transcript_51080/g.158229  ORF Transcript_51080/g.158229 Transcript_51080/m.158229 type:complete len:378 (+) Transcript_51080:39-1172(+)
MLPHAVATLLARPMPLLGARSVSHPSQGRPSASRLERGRGRAFGAGPEHHAGPGAGTAFVASAAALAGAVAGIAAPVRPWGPRAPPTRAASLVAQAAKDAPSGKPPEGDAAAAAAGTKAPDAALTRVVVQAGRKSTEDAAAGAPAAVKAAEDLEPGAAASAKISDPGRVALVAQRLVAAERSLRRWGYVAEVVYTWLGLISLGIASFAAFSHGSTHAYRSPAMALGPLSVGLSLICSLVGWFQARSCRSVGRRCGLAASSLEPGGPPPPVAQFVSVMPSVADIESGLRARQRTAWLGAMFAVVGMQAMVGLLVAKVLAASGGVSSPLGVSLDVFTLLSVSNAALSHIVGGGAAALQHHGLPPPGSPADDPFRGWGRR